MVDKELNENLGYGDIEYVADMLKAIVWVRDDLCGLTLQTRAHLTVQLQAAEKVLREAVEQMKGYESSF